MKSPEQLIAVRPMRADEGRLYLEIVNSAIRGLAVTHYPPETIAGWLVPIDDNTLTDLIDTAGAGRFTQCGAILRVARISGP